MDMIHAAWNPSAWDGGGTVQRPANFGTEGSLTHFRWTPTYVPPPDFLPFNPTWNRIAPVDFRQYVVSEAEKSALIQAGLLQVPEQLPAQYVPPGTASLSVK